MLSETKTYLERAYLNEKFFSHINWDAEFKPYSNWSVTILFYSAVHYFNAFICQTLGPDKVPTTHRTFPIYNKQGKKIREVLGRTDMAKKHLKVDLPITGVREAGNYYENLFKSSQNFRYEIYANFVSEKELEFAKNNFNRIKKIVCYELSCKICDNANKEASNLICVDKLSRKELNALAENIINFK